MMKNINTMGFNQYHYTDRYISISYLQTHHRKVKEWYDRHTYKYSTWFKFIYLILRKIYTQVKRIVTNNENIEMTYRELNKLVEVDIIKVRRCYGGWPSVPSEFNCFIIKLYHPTTQNLTNEKRSKNINSKLI